ncbi:MAG: carboxymuconolactone decarboxylase family protein [Deltaproteobacteria bacterium]|nr:carboxymuconolactone decarboxylase family protein [Deltaproteobacteria bacterium]MBW2254974.1 carboxymuconolactone decarboxylase family protein [Deltaproteobacteria bacterium]
MSREKIHEEMKQILGQVPGFFGSLPDDTLGAEWELFKRFETGDSTIPPKYRELIGVALAANEKCWYCANLHGAMARFHGATEAEVQESVQFAKFSAGWSTYLNGMLYDHDDFLQELNEIGQHLSGGS